MTSHTLGYIFWKSTNHIGLCFIMLARPVFERWLSCDCKELQSPSLGNPHLSNHFSLLDVTLGVIIHHGTA